MLALALRGQLLARHVREPDPLEEFAGGSLGSGEFVELGGGMGLTTSVAPPQALDPHAG